MRNDFANVLDRMFTISRALEPVAFDKADGGRQLWIPAIDIYESEEAFIIEADLPGVHAENVEIDFEQNTLTLKGNRAPTLPQNEGKSPRVFSAERVTGQFARAIRLPEYVDGERIEANYSHGVLTITVPKTKAALPRKIAIKATEN